jgi:sugar O-acyltransferase (sialic acid O-acetyltransferase NeuD family)
MMKHLIGVYGASGFGREVMPVARANSEDTATEFVFIDDNPDTFDILQKHKFMIWNDFLAHPALSKAVIIAIADSVLREKLTIRSIAFGVDLHPVTAHNVFIGDNVDIGEGAILQPFVTLTGNARIGRGFHANIYSYVAHDCVIGDFVTFAPGVMCNGNIRIEDHAYIGTGAILKQGTPENPLVIGANSVVGMGAVVTKSVKGGTTVVGNPARPMDK